MGLLEVHNLHIQLRQKQTLIPLVKALNLSINEAEVLALVGESGSGKSLSANALMRLLPQNMSLSADGLWLNQKNLLSLSERQMNQVRGRLMAMIFQEPQSALNPVKTLGQQLAEVLHLHQSKAAKAVKQRMLTLLNEVGLDEAEHRLKQYPHQLSGGQKQRLMIAMALAGEPKLLIADEPTTALDVTTQKQILDLLLELKVKRKLSILFITHDMSVVKYMADKVAVMHNGQIIEQQSANDFFAHPQQDYSLSLLQAHKRNLVSTEVKQATPVLQVKHLQVSYQRQARMFLPSQKVLAVADVSFEIYQGETFALVGESGSGKTTIGRAIIHLIKQQSGEVFFAGKPLQGLSRSQWRGYRRQIQIIFQDPFSSMNPKLTIGEIIGEGMQALLPQMSHAQRLAKMQTLLEKVGLDAAHLDRFAHEFSGGQRQRIAIARALALEPKLLICDEPTSALDVATRQQILNLLHELQQELGLAYLFITHDLNLVANFAHRVGVMQQGKLVEQGSSEQVLHSPSHSYTQTLLASALPLTEQEA